MDPTTRQALHLPPSLLSQGPYTNHTVESHSVANHTGTRSSDGPWRRADDSHPGTNTASDRTANISPATPKTLDERRANPVFGSCKYRVDRDASTAGKLDDSKSLPVES